MSGRGSEEPVPSVTRVTAGSATSIDNGKQDSVRLGKDLSGCFGNLREILERQI